MSWQIYLFISILFISLNGLWHRSLLKDDDSDPRAQAVIFLGIGGLFAILIAFLRGKLQLAFPLSLTINFLIIAVFSTIAYVLSYKAFKMIGPSEIAVLLVTGRLWNVLGAWLFLHEEVTINKLVGAVIIIIGVMITRFDKNRFTFNKGVLFVLIAAFFFGMSDISGYYILRSMDASNYQIYAELLPVLTLLLIQPSTLGKLKFYLHKNRAVKVTLLSIGDVIGMLALFFAYQAGGQASTIGPLRATSVILSVVLATIFLRERNNLKNKITGAIVTVFGVMLLL